MFLCNLGVKHVNVYVQQVLPNSFPKQRHQLHSPVSECFSLTNTRQAFQLGPFCGLWIGAVPQLTLHSTVICERAPPQMLIGRLDAFFCLFFW